VSVKVSGMRNFQTQIRKLGDSFGDAVNAGVFLTASEMRTYAIKSIQEQSPGKSVKRSRQGGGTYPHVAASPGQAPNTDTGKLVASIAVEKKAESTYFVGSGLSYAKYLEFGTSKMLARPWLQPAIRANRNALIDNIEKAVDLAVKGLK